MLDRKQVFASPGPKVSDSKVPFPLLLATGIWSQPTLIRALYWLFHLTQHCQHHKRKFINGASAQAGLGLLTH